jgi:hypothetical protein
MVSVPIINTYLFQDVNIPSIKHVQHANFQSFLKNTTKGINNKNNLFKNVFFMYK